MMAKIIAFLIQFLSALPLIWPKVRDFDPIPVRKHLGWAAYILEHHLIINILG